MFAAIKKALESSVSEKLSGFRTMPFEDKKVYYMHSFLSESDFP